MRADPLPHLASLAAAVAAAQQPAASFAALDAALAATIGHRLFTVLRHHAAAGWNSRVHSNQPAAYPVGGGKPVIEHPWLDLMLRQGLPWIAEDHAGLQWAFDDHALIRSLGCGSALTLPVRWQGRSLGVLSLLHEAGWYREADKATGQLFAAMAVPALLVA